MDSHSSDGHTLVEALAAGDERAFEEVVRRHHAAVVRLVRAYVRYESIAEGVAQDVWAAVVTGVDRFEGRSSFKTWLFSIAANRARSRQRLAVTLRDVEGLDSEEVCEVMRVAPGNEPVLLHRARTRLREALEESLAGSAQLVG
jgi:DNA-directed RNA polymerase specialized sigma24 family protein